MINRELDEAVRQAFQKEWSRTEQICREEKREVRKSPFYWPDVSIILYCVNRGREKKLLDGSVRYRLEKMVEAGELIRVSWSPYRYAPASTQGHD